MGVFLTFRSMGSGFIRCLLGLAVEGSLIWCKINFAGPVAQWQSGRLITVWS
jgi:hypothetical protein